ncbi:DUF3800 domain-containing protein [Mucisphaera calidilacus]|uniref:DUF3800 domain-containing protein n=1 Tax=Mucisphaera calidilacus TaxID=2527982 RepID=A0A518C0P7_9BACT|nr:DUF3800 domain-containing protein [Mucisphaera calidilacus]QDU72799.1 hypothetical protein Pan265_26730 [Mucisphaera calidilacus]
MSVETHRKSHYYFVDESGVPDIWGRRKNDLVIDNPASRFFLIGLVEIKDVTTVSNAIDHLRAMLLRDPRFSTIPSLDVSKRKTAVEFHAKNDHPRVRERVFTLLCQAFHNIRYSAVVRDKRRVRSIVEAMKTIDPTYRYHPNSLYDALVRRLFNGRLHFEGSRYTVYFAQRGKSDRQAALLSALENAQRDYEQYAGLDETEPSIRFVSGYPRQYQGLQVVDYFNWALQRFYERDDNHYWKRLWDAGKVRCVIDPDATGRYREGEIYTASNPLTGEFN